jgi:hypothetical protein
VASVLSEAEKRRNVKVNGHTFLAVFGVVLRGSEQRRRGETKLSSSAVHDDVVLLDKQKSPTHCTAPCGVIASQRVRESRTNEPDLLSARPGLSRYQVPSFAARLRCV